MLRMARHVHAADRACENLCLAGGVALNCVANGRLLREGPFEDIWIQPAAGDAGGALGAALFVWHQLLGQPAHADGRHDAHAGRAASGPRFADERDRELPRRARAPYRAAATTRSCCDRVADLHRRGEGRRLVPGPHGVRPARARRRAASSATPRSPRDAVDDEPEDQVPRVVPALRARRCCAERRRRVLRARTRDSPYMLLVAPVQRGAPRVAAEDEQTLLGHRQAERAPLRRPGHHARRLLGADADRRPRGTTRATTRCIEAFERQTGCPVLINTSFNVRGEPIVCTPEDAYRCFMRTDMDYLVLDDFLLAKKDQPPAAEDGPGGRRCSWTSPNRVQNA